jgi:hypothetical protein
LAITNTIWAAAVVHGFLRIRAQQLAKSQDGGRSLSFEFNQGRTQNLPALFLLHENRDVEMLNVPVRTKSHGGISGEGWNITPLASRETWRVARPTVTSLTFQPDLQIYVERHSLRRAEAAHG